MHGATGYRAHYSVGVGRGEEFNRRLVETVVPLVIAFQNVRGIGTDPAVFRKSLLGKFSKLWFTKDLTDPSAEGYLQGLEEEITVPRWVAFWRERVKPWKGLLVPVPDEPAVLLNGTFVNNAGQEYEQKPGRSQEIFDSGWTWGSTWFLVSGVIRPCVPAGSAW
jgi:hypothetical protein